MRLEAILLGGTQKHIQIEVKIANWRWVQKFEQRIKKKTTNLSKDKFNYYNIN